MTDDDDRRICGPCEHEGRPGWRTPERGWCPACGFFFDEYGMRLLEPWITCPVHDPIMATCPHSGALT